MRDIFFMAVLPLMLYAMAKRPFVALGMWIWTAMFFPNAWLYGFASGFRYNLLFTGVAIAGYVVLRDKPRLVMHSIVGLVLLFFAWTTVSTMLTVGSPDVAWDIWGRFFKVVLLFLFVVLIVEKKLHVDFFLWCLVLSLGFYAGLEALKYISSGGGHKIAGFAGHVLGDRNELAVAFVMTLPVCVYLMGEYGKQSLLIRYGFLGLMALIVFAVIGTQSRGGFIALLGLGGFFFLKSERKILLSVLVLALVVALSYYVPPEWTARMDTIGEAREDASFMTRVVAWKLSFILAMQNPLFGGGFKALEQYAVWSRLCEDFFSYPFFYTGDALPNPLNARAAHSVYFQILGDHGFGGLIIYLLLLLRTFLSARALTRLARQYSETHWIASVGTMLQLCLFAFCVGGAALSFAYFEVLFALCGLAVVLEKRILPAALERQRLAST
ncbi:MAG: putative O-glycosylation ligase, exosortase A system-associated [Pseudomonadota bacterium]